MMCLVLESWDFLDFVEFGDDVLSFACFWDGIFGIFV